VSEWAEWAREGFPLAPTEGDVMCLQAVGGYEAPLYSMTLRLDPVQSTDRRYPYLVELIRGADCWYIEVRVGELTPVRAWLTLESIHLKFTNRNYTFVQMLGRGSPAAIDHIKSTILTLVRQGILDFPRVSKGVDDALGLCHHHKGAFNLRRMLLVIEGRFEASVHTASEGRHVYTRYTRGTE
jgi:hypothetical protein